MTLKMKNMLSILMVNQLLINKIKDYKTSKMGSTNTMKKLTGKTQILFSSH
jgi:hypothetical protein